MILSVDKETCKVRINNYRDFYITREPKQILETNARYYSNHSSHIIISLKAMKAYADMIEREQFKTVVI